MTATITKTIKASGGDYTSLAAWEAAENGDLVAADEIRRALCYDLGAYDTSTDIGGGTVDATRYIVVEAAVNHRRVWNTSVYRIQGGSSTQALGSSQNYTRIIGIQAESGDGTGGAFMLGLFFSGATCRAERCIVRAGPNAASGASNFAGLLIGDTSSVVTNCIVYGFVTNAGITISDAGSTTIAYNNTVYNCARGIRCVGGSNVLKNNIANGCSIADFVGGSASSTNNCSSDGTHPGSNGQTGSVTFGSTTAGSEDLRLRGTDTVAIGHGTDLSADATFPVTVDNGNTTRGSTWDIGAVQSPATVTRRAIFQPAFDARGWFSPHTTAIGWWNQDLVDVPPAATSRVFMYAALDGIGGSGPINFYPQQAA